MLRGDPPDDKDGLKDREAEIAAYSDAYSTLAVFADDIDGVLEHGTAEVKVALSVKLEALDNRGANETAEKTEAAVAEVISAAGVAQPVAVHYINVAPQAAFIVQDMVPVGSNNNPRRLTPAQLLAAVVGDVRRTDRTVMVAAAMIAVASGVLALYVTKDTWGVWSDWLAAVTWGATVSAGITAVTNIISSKLPAGGGAAAASTG